MSNRRPCTAALALAAALLPPAAASAEIVSKGRDEASKLVNEWFAAGEAAGLAGVFYDNRDRKHSSLGIATYPQMKPITYTDAELRVRADWGGARKVLPGKVVIGNSSTASPANQAGSHQRMFYTYPRGLQFLYEQYRSNALYVYPEHRDHDPGTNGADGYGDLYPANSPYLISSQGSSGSDRVFMHAFLKTIAAFPPKTRQVLISKGLLMPTLQAIFRQTYKASKASAEPAGYFTGAAHPSAFEGGLINELAMVNRAHAMTPEAIPPLAKLQVVGERELVAGRDFFEPPQLGARAEALADSPCAIARVVRGLPQKRTLHVSAEGSIDPYDRPLKFRWVVLRGDPDLIDIKTVDEDAAKATIEVKYHPRRPIAPGSAMWSNRVDIGVFAKAEGSIASAPAFVSLTTLPNEHRSYAEDGRLLEIFYGARSKALGIPPADSERWAALLARFDAEPDAVLNSVLDQKVFAALHATTAATKTQRDALAAADAKLEAITKTQQALVDRTNKTRTEAAAAHKKANDATSKAALDAATAKHNAAKKAMRDGDGGAAALKTEIAGLRGEIGAVLRDKNLPAQLRAEMGRLVELPTFSAQFAAHSKTKAGLARLESFGVKVSKDPPPGERHHLEQLNRDLLATVVFPGFLKRPAGALYADPRLTSPGKNWRDVYQYNATTEKFLGWKRYRGGEVFNFDAAGRWLKGGRPVAVRYFFDPRTKRLDWAPAG